VKEGNLPKKDRRTYSDRREYLIRVVQKRRRNIRKKAVNYKGGKCLSALLLCANCHHELHARNAASTSNRSRKVGELREG